MTKQPTSAAEPNFPDFSVFYSSPEFHMNEDEIDRQTVEHFTFKLAFKQNFVAPVDNVLTTGGARCLDVGTGMGIWVMEMSADFPNSEFIGVDKFPTFPAEVYPRNAEFLIMDATKPWPYKDGTFDLVQQRMLAHSYKRDDWDLVLKEMLRVTKPGGWVQLVECGVITQRASKLTVKLCNWVVDVLKSQELDPLIYDRLGKALEEHGFQNVEENFFSIPFGKWGGAVGTLLKEDAKGWADNLKPTVVSLLGVSDSEYDEALSAMMKDCETLKSYTNFCVSCGQKPLK